MKAGLEASIRARAAELGFERASFSVAGPAPRAAAFRRWLGLGFAGEMGYLERAPESRENVTVRSPWARTIISVSARYASGGETRNAAGPGIVSIVSRYARGADYHGWLKLRLEDLAGFIRAEAGGRVEARALVDTSAILERDHATAAGSGWTGKNAMVIDPESGSYHFLGEVLTNLELGPGSEMEDLCGGCTRCIQACPTGAIVAERVVDARRCISYLTIELKGSVPADLRGAIGEHLFGCDICQEVCPWNATSTSRAAPADPDSRTLPVLEQTTLQDAVSMDEPGFAARFRGSAIARTKRRGLVRSALIVAANRGDGAALRAGRRLLEDAEPVLRETAVWALARGEAGERRAAGISAEREEDPVLRRTMLDSLDR